MVAIPDPSSTSSTTPTFTPPPPTITEEEIDDLLYFSRSGESTDLKETLKDLSKKYNRYELEILAAAIDPHSGNTCLHMSSANNHSEIVEYILGLHSPGEEINQEVVDIKKFIPADYLVTFVNVRNTFSKNTALHWACLNGHLGVVKLLMERGGGDPGILNDAGHDCVYEAEVNDKNEVVDWVLKYSEELERVVGVQGDAGEEDGEEGEEEDVGGSELQQGILKNEGSAHEERVQEEGSGSVATGLKKLGLEDVETIR